MHLKLTERSVPDVGRLSLYSLELSSRTEVGLGFVRLGQRGGPIKVSIYFVLRDVAYQTGILPGARVVIEPLPYMVLIHATGGTVTL